MLSMSECWLPFGLKAFDGGLCNTLEASKALRCPELSWALWGLPFLRRRGVGDDKVSRLIPVLKCTLGQTSHNITLFNRNLSTPSAAQPSLLIAHESMKHHEIHETFQSLALQSQRNAAARPSTRKIRKVESVSACSLSFSGQRHVVFLPVSACLHTSGDIFFYLLLFFMLLFCMPKHSFRSTHHVPSCVMHTTPKYSNGWHQVTAWSCPQPPFLFVPSLPAILFAVHPDKWCGTEFATTSRDSGPRLHRFCVRNKFELGMNPVAWRFMGHCCFEPQVLHRRWWMGTLIHPWEISFPNAERFPQTLSKSCLIRLWAGRGVHVWL